MILILRVLIGVAFLTLYERKILGYVQTRKGPNKVGVKGILQPFRDAIKLFTKERNLLQTRNFNLYMISPVLRFTVVLVLWVSYPARVGFMEVRISIVFILCCLRVGVYPVLGAGWASNSKYSLLGRLRAVAQTISYEVRLAFILLRFIILTQGVSAQGLLEINGQ